MMQPAGLDSPAALSLVRSNSMCIYCNTKNYRKIYINHFGPIPKDPEGRSYDIHHIDGDHSNNDPSNLKAITICEHYEIHYKQGDYGSCYKISRRMKMSPAEISQIAKEAQLKLSKEKRHSFQIHRRSSEEQSRIAKEVNRRLLEEGKHPFQNKENTKRALETH